MDNESIVAKETRERNLKLLEVKTPEVSSNTSVTEETSGPEVEVTGVLDIPSTKVTEG
jgi:hypothetical protein